MRKIRVFVADDHALLRSGLRLLIDAQNDMQVVGEAGDLVQTKRELAAARPDVLTLDLSMPGGAGMASISTIRGLFPEVKVLVVTMHDDPAYVRAALAIGAAGYVVKSAADTELISAIRAVHQGRIFVDAQLVVAPTGADALGVSSRGDSSRAPIETLSSREREVLALIAQGHTNQAAADQMGLSVKTVESYRARLMEKLGLASRADLTRVAIECGLLGANQSHE
jgi:DNA-binding NarL/FixJ family response regulator